MEARFLIFTDGQHKIIDIDYKFVDYPYMVYTYRVGDEEMDPLEDINHMDDESPKNMPMNYWTLEEVVNSLTKLRTYIADHAEMLSENEDWVLNTICSPLENVIAIDEVIELLKQHPGKTMMATVAFYED